MKMNIPWNTLAKVKRYAVRVVSYKMCMTPNVQVTPRTNRRAIAPLAQDLWNNC